MSANPEEPDWSLLPHAPLRFFGLSEGFSHRDLKRTYNQFIRRYKPERFPQEFQRIRAAYEHLENALRYGQSVEDSESTGQSYEWMVQSDVPVPRHQDGREIRVASTETPVPLHERIRSGSVTAVYRELQERKDKTPYDYYALAVLADVVDRRDGRQFVEWILQGLTAYPNEIGLMRLLHAYFGGPVEAAHQELLLVECSKIIREDLFFPLTDPLWRSLLGTGNFGKFRDTLRRCEANLKGVSIDNRLAFYLQILRSAMWVADPDWIDEKYAFIEQNFERIPDFLDYDVELLARLRAYIAVRETFSQGGEVRQRLDQAMRDYFCEDQLTGDRGVLACQVFMAQETERLAAAFAEFGSMMYAPFYALWLWVSYDVGERHVEPPKEQVDERIWHERTNTLCTQMERQTRGSRLGAKWATRRVLYRVVQASSFFVLPLIISIVGAGIVSVFNVSRGGRSREDAIIALATLAGVIIGVFGGFWTSKQITKRYWQPFEFRMAAECYGRIWQREIINFLARSQLPYQVLRAFILSIPNTVTSTPWVKYYVEQDYTLPMFAIAQRFVV